MTIKLIGLTGKKQVGKDTAAEMLNEQFNNEGYKYCEFAFADALKTEVSLAIGAPLEVIKEQKEAFRPILQWWGTDFRRNMFGRQYWVQKVFEKMGWAAKNLKEDDKAVFVIKDVRFVEELQFIKRSGGVIIRIERDKDQLNLPLDTHASEVALDGVGVDYVVRNNGTFVDLSSELSFIVDELVEEVV